MNTIEHLKIGFPDYEFANQKLTQGWERYFVKFQGTSLGRISLRDGEIKSVKWYKPLDYEYSPEDDFFYLWELWLKKSKRIDLRPLVHQAKKIRRYKIDLIKEWREENPVYDKNGDMKKRKKINISWMGEFRKLVSLTLINN